MLMSDILYLAIEKKPLLQEMRHSIKIISCLRDRFHYFADFK